MARNIDKIIKKTRKMNVKKKIGPARDRSKSVQLSKVVAHCCAYQRTGSSAAIHERETAPRRPAAL